MTQRNSLSPSLDAVVAKFNHWRTHRTKRGKIPDDLMDQACELATRLPLCQVASALRLNPTELKRQCQLRQSVHTAVRALPAPTWVEVAAALAPVVPDAPIRMALQRTDGLNLQIQVDQVTVAAQLINQWLRG